MFFTDKKIYIWKILDEDTRTFLFHFYIFGLTRSSILIRNKRNNRIERLKMLSQKIYEIDKFIFSFLGSGYHLKILKKN